MPTCFPQWFQSIRSRAKRCSTDASDRLAELHLARAALINCMQDCPDDHVRRLKQKIQIARSHRELWFLRSDIYHCVAMHHDQATADERLDALALHFE